MGQKHRVALLLVTLQTALFFLLLLPLGSGIDVRDTGQEDDAALGKLEKQENKRKKQIPIKREYSESCWGYESPWSDCSSYCTQEKRFRLRVDKDCPASVPLNDSVQVRLCMGGDCPMTRNDPNPFLMSFRQAMFDFGFETERIEALAEMSEALQLPLQVMILFIVSSVCWARSFRASWIPDVVVAMPVAAVFAMALRFICFRGNNFGDVMIESLAKLVSSLMNDLLLPITIYVGAFTVDRLNMFAEFGCSLVLAVVGTLAQIFLVFVMIRISGADYFGFHVVDNWREALVYASFIADVDPVITLSIFQKLKVPPLLFTLAGGEGLLNDPIALVIFGMLNVDKKEIEISVTTVATAIVWDLIGSAVLGCVIGVALTKYMNVMKVPGKGSLECIYLLCSAYFSYALGEYLALSGIIVSLFAGFVMGGLCSHLCANVHQVEEFLENLAVLAEMGMFMIAGFGTFMIQDREHMRLGLITVPFCIIARAITIAILVPAMNVMRQAKRMDLIDAGTGIMLFWCNLRGSIVVMMALEVKSYWSPHQETILGASIIVIIVMNYLSGCTIPLVFYLTGVPLGKDFPPGSLYHPDSKMSKMMTRIHSQTENWAAWNGRRDRRLSDSDTHEMSGSDGELGPPPAHEMKGRQMGQPSSLRTGAASKGAIELTQMTAPVASLKIPTSQRNSDLRMVAVPSNVTEVWDGDDSDRNITSDDEDEMSDSRHAGRKDIHESY